MRLGAALGVAAVAWGYPLDGGARTGIRRLAGYKLTLKLPPGAYLPSDRVVMRLASRPSFDITASTPRDPYLEKGLAAIFAARDSSYSIALVDISDPAQPRYAAIREGDKRIPGSVGKLMVATGVFGSLQRIFPNDTAARERLLRETMVEGGAFVHRDSKTVPFFQDGDKAVTRRRLEAGDRFNLYEWLDHMLSESSNGAGSVVWRQAMLLFRYGPRYPPSPPDAEALFRDTAKKDLAHLALESLETAARESGLDTGKLRIGTFFTSQGERAVPGTASYACPSELMRWLLKMEQGKLVDAWSSLEIKRLLYFTRPRYRYCSSPALDNAAVYFKSGSLFECRPEPGYECVQYKGNKTNLMHSVAVVESGKKVYLVALMSNVLKLNSAVEHQTIAGLIEKLVQSRPGGPD